MKSYQRKINTAKVDHSHLDGSSYKGRGYDHKSKIFRTYRIKAEHLVPCLAVVLTHTSLEVVNAHIGRRGIVEMKDSLGRTVRVIYT